MSVVVDYVGDVWAYSRGWSLGTLGTRFFETSCPGAKQMPIPFRLLYVLYH